MQRRANNAVRASAVLVAFAIVWARSPQVLATEIPRIVLHAGTEAELLTRVRGQTADLPIQLVVAEEAPSNLQPLAGAAEVGARYGASIVIWFEPTKASGWDIYIADVAQGDLLVRRVVIQAGADRLDASAAAEAAALIVRSTLSSLTAGGRIGVAAEDTQAKPADEKGGKEVSVPEPHATEEISPDDALSAGGGGRGARTRMLFLRAGLQIGADLAPAVPYYGPAAFGGFRFGSLELGGGASYALGRTIEDSFTRIRLVRYGVAVRGATILWSPGPFELSAGMELGALVYERTTEALEARVRATPSRSIWTPVVSPALDASYWPASVPLGFFASITVDLPAAVPVFEYETPDGEVERARAWPFQPRLTLGFLLRSDFF